MCRLVSGRVELCRLVSYRLRLFGCGCVCVCVISCRVWGPEHEYLLAFLKSSLGGPQEHAYLPAFLESSWEDPRNIRIYYRSWNPEHAY